MAESALETLFVNWWNFPAAIEDVRWGRIVGLEEITPAEAHSERFLSVPFLTQLIHITAGNQERIGEPQNQETSQVWDSLLDLHLRAESPAEKFLEFERQLLNTKAHFRAIFSTRKTAVGSLADLCALRLAGIVSRKPSPVFFSEDYFDKTSMLRAGTYRISSPQLWLPTDTGRRMRSQLLRGDIQVGVPVFLYFLAGNYFPEGHGFLPPVPIGPDQWAKICDGKDYPPISEQAMVGDLAHVSRRRGRLVEPVRLTLLASIFLSRSILSSLSPRISSPFRHFSDMSLSWRGNGFLDKANRKKFIPNERLVVEATDL